MYAGLKKVLEMSNDARISDKQFRSAMQHMIDERFHQQYLGFAARLEILHQEAIDETMRDEMVEKA